MRRNQILHQQGLGHSWQDDQDQLIWPIYACPLLDEQLLYASMVASNDASFSFTIFLVRTFNLCVYVFTCVCICINVCVLVCIQVCVCVYVYRCVYVCDSFTFCHLIYCVS